MKLEYLSASRLNKYFMCPFSYFLRYELGIEDEVGIAATQGSAVHMVLERIAKNGKIDGWEDFLSKAFLSVDILKKISGDRLPLKKCKMRNLDTCNIYNEQCSKICGKCPIKEYDDCCKMIRGVFNRKTCNPFDLKILDVEKKFDISFKEGFRILGYVDLVSELSHNDLIEIRDWKTGKRMVEVDKIKKDPQMIIYNLAASELYKSYPFRILTLDYLQHRPISVTFEEEEELEHIARLKKIWDRIKGDTSPVRKQSWKCDKFCSFGNECEKRWEDFQKGEIGVKNEKQGRKN